MTTSIPTRVPTAAPSSRRRRATRALAVLAASAGAAALWVLAVPIAGADLAVRMDGRTQPIGLASVVGVSLIVGSLGWALLAVLEFRTRRAIGIWTVVALAVAVLSLAGPLTSAATGGAGAVLVGLHVVVAAVLIPVLRRTSRVG